MEIGDIYRIRQSSQDSIKHFIKDNDLVIILRITKTYVQVAGHCQWQFRSDYSTQNVANTSLIKYVGRASENLQKVVKYMTNKRGEIL